MHHSPCVPPPESRGRHEYVRMRHPTRLARAAHPRRVNVSRPALLAANRTTFHQVFRRLGHSTKLAALRSVVRLVNRTARAIFRPVEFTLTEARSRLTLHFWRKKRSQNLSRSFLREKS